MIRLVPTWMEKYDEFWEAIKRRNLLFIKLRYVAVVTLLLFNFLFEKVIDMHFSVIQHNVILILSLFLLVYNISIHSLHKFLKNIAKAFNPLQLSLLQISLDLIILTSLIYFTGGIESPFKWFYIFHIIIGSLILPGYVIYFITTLSLFAVSAISFLEYFGHIPHFPFDELYITSHYNNLQYVIVHLFVFGLMMYISTFLTNRIACQLYAQEKKLLDALDKINKSEVKKQKYIMGVVHEIKTPIAATKSILTLITDGFVGEITDPVKRKLNRAIIRTTESLGMINSILRISRLRLLDERSSEKVNVYKLVEDLLQENRERLEEKSLVLEKNYKDNKRSIIEGDKFLLQLAVSNIISNAIKYTAAKGKIVISFSYSDEFLWLSICDTGVGVEKSDFEKIFENYYRAKNIEEEYHDGSGVGLSLVKEIIEQHRGIITALSPSPIGTKDNPGTCFEIKLPYSFKKAGKINKESIIIENRV